MCLGEPGGVGEDHGGGEGGRGRGERPRGGLPVDRRRRLDRRAVAEHDGAVTGIERDRAGADRAGSGEVARLAEPVVARRERVAETVARAPPDRDDAPRRLERDVDGAHVRLAPLEQLTPAEAMAGPSDRDAHAPSALTATSAKRTPVGEMVAARAGAASATAASSVVVTIGLSRMLLSTGRRRAEGGATISESR
jgi:hypothetical protein